MGITRLKLPPKGRVHTYFIAGDWHSYHCHGPSYRILSKIAKTYPKNQRKLIINGDFIDAEHLMKNQESFKKWIKRPEGVEEYFIPETEKELCWANEMLDHLEKIFPEIIFIEGNHDWRLRWFMNGPCPHAYRPNFDLQKQLNLKKRNITFVHYNDWLDVGRLSITHGMFHGSTCAKKHYEAAGGRSVIFSHVHKFECRPFMSRGEAKQSWSLPAMCHLNPDYIKNTENNWTNGFGVIQMKSNGNFHHNVHQIWDDELIYQGKLVKG